ncbi:MAG TPA: AMP-binding protein, partial [Candidatus Limnocylindrales bacterium]
MSEPVAWAELDARADAFADLVLAAGVPRGGVVAVDAPGSIEAAAAILGIVRGGAVAAPLPDGRTAVERGVSLELLDPVLVLGRDSVARAGRVLDAPGVVVLTSGTTAAPKGVVLPTTALDASSASWTAALPPATGWLLALGLAHVAGIGVLWRAAAARVPMWAAAPGDAEAQLAALRGDPAPSHVSLVPAQLVRLLDLAGGAPPPPTLRAVLLGGGSIPPALVIRALDAGWPVVPTYGLSEAGSGVTALATDEALEASASAGRPLPGVRVTIDDAGTDGVGEIVVETPARFSGYLDDMPAEGPIRTGDMGRLDEAGRLFVVDRRVDLIVRGGENVSPAEVEAVLTAQPAIGDAAV